MNEPLNLAGTDRQRLAHLRALGVELQNFYDVGAAHGVWSEQVSRDFPKANFNLFEPLVDHVPTYQAKLEQLLATHPQCRLHKIALGSGSKRVLMHLYPNPTGSTALPMETPPQDTKCIEVRMMPLDGVVYDLRLPRPHAIKIDTQGCELDILKGAEKVLSDTNLLILECWLARRYGKFTPLLSEIIDWLQPLGFFLWDFGDQFRDAKGILRTQDCFFLNARSKVSPLHDEILAKLP